MAWLAAKFGGQARNRCIAMFFDQPLRMASPAQQFEQRSVGSAAMTLSARLDVNHRPPLCGNRANWNIEDVACVATGPIRRTSAKRGRAVPEQEAPKLDRPEVERDMLLANFDPEQKRGEKIAHLLGRCRIEQRGRGLASLSELFELVPVSTEKLESGSQPFPVAEEIRYCGQNEHLEMVRPAAIGATVFLL